MKLRWASIAFLTAVFLAGCSLPRGPINIDPLVPRWISHRDLSTECPPPHALEHDAGMAVDPSALQPPHSKFHPVPTRPVFEPGAAHQPQPLGL
jgi:hypothetical protein